MHDLNIKEVSTVSGGSTWEVVYKAGKDGANDGNYSDQPTNRIIDVCNNAGGAPYPDSAAIQITYSQTGTLMLAGSGTAAVNAIQVTANCGDARKAVSGL